MLEAVGFALLMMTALLHYTDPSAQADLDRLLSICLCCLSLQSIKNLSTY